jgi:hypothetical protein
MSAEGLMLDTSTGIVDILSVWRFAILALLDM